MDLFADEDEDGPLTRRQAIINTMIVKLLDEHDVNDGQDMESSEVHTHKFCLCTRRLQIYHRKLVGDCNSKSKMILWKIKNSGWWARSYVWTDSRI